MSIADWLESLGKRSQQHKQRQRQRQNAPGWRDWALANAASMYLVPHLKFQLSLCCLIYAGSMASMKPIFFTPWFAFHLPLDDFLHKMGTWIPIQSCLWA